MTLLRAHNLRVSYGDTTPVDGVDLTINPREVVGLVGDAGSGKSTLALALLGLARPPGRITGHVDFDGRDLLTLPDDQIRQIRGRDIGIIVQNPRAALNPMLRVGRQIGYAHAAHNPPTDTRAKAVEMLRLVGINDPERRVDSFAHELSGGMAQRALIAMALSSRPKLLIADEPTSGLDVTIQAQFLDQMWRTVQDTGSAILLVSQELGVIANYCDRVLVLHDGRIVEDAPVRDFFANPQAAYSQDMLRLYRERGEAFPAPIRNPQPLLKTDALTKHFPLRNSSKVVQAVDKVTLTISKGEAVGLVGESGSGKTTVGRCLLRLIDPTSGHILFDGTDITALNGRRPAQTAFENPDRLSGPLRQRKPPLDDPGHPDRTPDDPRPRTDHRAKAEAAMRLVDLDPALLSRKPRGLGASTLQRVSIARALILDPEFVVLDEPTSVLAPAPAPRSSRCSPGCKRTSASPSCSSATT